MKASGISEVRTYAAFLGFGFYWAWVTVVFYSDALAPGVSGADGMVETVWLWATWAHAIALLSHAALAHRFPSALDGRALKLGGSIGTAVGTALIPLVLFSFGTESLISTVSIPVFAVLIGVTSAWLVLQWAERYAALARGRVTTLSLLSFLCGLFVYFLFIALPAPITTVTAVMLPLFSGASMAFCEIDGARVLGADGEKSERGATGETHLLPRFSIGLLLSAFAVFVFALCGEMLRAFSLQLTNAGVNEMGSLYLLGGTLGLLALTTYLIAPVGRRDRKRITLSLVRNILIIMAAAFLLAAWFSPRSVRRVWLTGAAWALFFVAIDTASAPFLNRENSLRPMFEVCRAMERSGRETVLLSAPERTRGAAYFYLRRNVREIRRDETPSADAVLITRSKSGRAEGKPFADHHWLIP